jgi:hypothetical protein
MDKEIRTKGLIMLIVCALTCVSFVDRSNPKLENQANQTFQFLEKYPIKALPLTDSTNIDNYKNTETLTTEQSNLLKLEKIESDKEVKFSLNYRLNLSANFKTLVVSYNPNEQVLVTVLINYTNSFDIVDFKTIAYDEIAESWISSQSLINSDKIEITERNESSGSLVIKKTIFEIKKDGRFKASQ